LKDIFLGWAGANPSGREPLVLKGDGSLLVVARPGGGKTRGLIIPNLVHYEGSVIITDTKDAELARATALWRRHVLGHKVIVIDPFRIADPKYLPKK
jgi:type IV secretion system protein VirD4